MLAARSEEARRHLATTQGIDYRTTHHHTDTISCRVCGGWSRYIDALSIAYDLAVAQMCDERTLVMVP